MEHREEALSFRIDALLRHILRDRSLATSLRQLRRRLERLILGPNKGREMDRHRAARPQVDVHVERILRRRVVGCEHVLVVEREAGVGDEAEGAAAPDGQEGEVDGTEFGADVFEDGADVFRGAEAVRSLTGIKKVRVNVVVEISTQVLVLVDFRF